MTYIVAKHRTIGGKRYGPYLHEVDSVRTGDTVKQVHIKYIGQPGGTNFASSFNVTNPDGVRQLMDGVSKGEISGYASETHEVAESYDRWFSNDWKEMRKTDEFKNKKAYQDYYVREQVRIAKSTGHKITDEAIKKAEVGWRSKAGGVYDNAERVKAGANHAPVFEGSMVRITSTDMTYLEKGDTYKLRSMASFAEPGTSYSSTFENSVLVIRNGKGRIISKAPSSLALEKELLVSKGTKFHVQKVTKNVSGKALMKHLPGRKYAVRIGGKMNVIELVQLEGEK